MVRRGKSNENAERTGPYYIRGEATTTIAELALSVERSVKGNSTEIFPSNMLILSRKALLDYLKHFCVRHTPRSM